MVGLEEWSPPALSREQKPAYRTRRFTSGMMRNDRSDASAISRRVPRHARGGDCRKRIASLAGLLSDQAASQPHRSLRSPIHLPTGTHPRRVTSRLPAALARVAPLSSENRASRRQANLFRRAPPRSANGARPPEPPHTFAPAPRPNSQRSLQALLNRSIPGLRRVKWLFVPLSKFLRLA